MSQHIPTAKIKSTPHSRLSLAWAVPVVAIAIAIILFFHWQMNRGPIVILKFQDISGLTTESPIIYRGAIVGRVERISLQNDLEQVVVRARLDVETSDLAREGSTWWIVKPTVSLQGISGLETLIGPRYIQVQPGLGTPTFAFDGSTDRENDEGKLFTLQASTAGNISVGAPILYRGIEIGSITSILLGEDARKVRMQCNIELEYVQLIRTNTLFWKVGGISFDAGWLGVRVETSPLTTLINGGIAIATPDRFGDLAKDGFLFTIEDEFDDDWLEWEPAIELSKQVELE